MSSIEPQLVETQQAKPLVAVREAFSALKNGGQYTLKMVAFCGMMMGIMFWIQERFSFDAGTASLIRVLIEAMFVFYWHRFFLLGETEISGADYFPFIKRSLLYYVVFVLLFIGIVLAMGSSNAPRITTLNAVAAGLGMVGTVALLVLAPRIALVFPAIAVGNPARSMADAFALSAGNALRLAAGYILMLVAIMVPLLVVAFYVDEYLPELLTSEVYLIVSNLTAGLMAAVMVLLWTGMNSSFYRQLGGDIHPPKDLGADEELQDNDGGSAGPTSGGYGR